MRSVAIIRFPGSNCDEDSLRAAEFVGATARYVWHRESTLGDADVVILPGGFSYGDYLRSGAIARFSPVMGAVQAHASAGGAVLGICNGFQILCEAHLLPGALVRNDRLRFASRPVRVRVERTSTAFTSSLTAGSVLSLPVAHGDGRFAADAETIAMLEAEGRVVLRYVDDTNPNGSASDIAGLCNAHGNVVGVMPHPERVIEPMLGAADGLGFFASMLQRAAGSPA